MFYQKWFASVFLIGKNKMVEQELKKQTMNAAAQTTNRARHDSHVIAGKRKQAGQGGNRHGTLHSDEPDLREINWHGLTGARAHFECGLEQKRLSQFWSNTISDRRPKWGHHLGLE
jgi:hypothetical protein